jgi:hypothetical protein
VDRFERYLESALGRAIDRSAALRVGAQRAPPWCYERASRHDRRGLPLDDQQEPAAAVLLLDVAVGKRVAASGTTLEIQMAAGPIIRTRAGTSAESSRLTSSRLLTGVETGSQEVARGFPDSHRRHQHFARSGSARDRPNRLDWQRPGGASPLVGPVTSRNRRACGGMRDRDPRCPHASARSRLIAVWRGVSCLGGGPL